MIRRTTLAILAALLAASASAQTVTPAQNVTAGTYAIYQAFPAFALTGTSNGVETNMAAVRIPAGSLGPSGAIRLTLLFSCTNSANNKIINIRFSSTAGALSAGSVGTETVTTIASGQSLWILRNSNVTNSQTHYGPGSAGVAPYGTGAAANLTTNVDTTNDAFVNINGTLALGSETLTLLAYTVEVLRP